MAENTAGQQRPTSASGTTVRPGASGAPNVAGPPGGSARGARSQLTVTSAVLLTTGGRASGPSAPAAIASTERIALEASLTVTIGIPPSTVQDGSVNRIWIQTSESGTLSVIVSSADSSSRAPVDGCVALRFS